MEPKGGNLESTPLQFVSYLPDGFKSEKQPLKMEAKRTNSDHEIESTPLQLVTFLPDRYKNEKNSEINNGQHVQKADTWFLYFTILTGTVLIFVTGASFVWTSPVIPRLTSNNSNENPIGWPISTTEVSLIAGVPSIMMLFGSIILGKLSEVIGRKKCLHVIGLGILLTKLSIAFSTSVILIVIFRCILYFFLIGALTILPIYITETCEDHNRAKYGCLMGMCLPLGNLYSFIFGSLLGVKYFTLVIAAPLIYFLIFFSFSPESPIFLLSKGKQEECLKSLRRLRSNKTEIELLDDLHKIQLSIKSKVVNSESNVIALFRTRPARLGMLLALGPVVVQNLSGVTVIMSFLAPLFNEAGTYLSGNNMAIIVGCVKVSSFLFTSMIVERTGRRKMLILSSIGTGVPLFILGIFFYLKVINSSLMPYLQWLPIVCVVSNVILYALGLGPIPMAIMGEYFPSELRSLAVSFIMIIYGLIMFITTFTYPYIATYLGVHWCVWIFSSICFMGSIFIYIKIPETKGKSLLQIQDYLRKK